jgi:ubiquitin C-terminal hydrolase
MALELNAGEQQDAQEFSKLLLSLIDELLAKSEHQGVRTMIKDAFTGECQYETECSVCNTKVVQNSVFNELELTVNKQLRESIEQYLRVEILDGSNKYRCGTCQMDQPAGRSFKLKKLPPVLNLQLMRFVYDM